jgi:hypothetical protein
MGERERDVEVARPRTTTDDRGRPTWRKTFKNEAARDSPPSSLWLHFFGIAVQTDMPATAGRCRMPAGNRVALSATSITSGGMWNSINSTEPTAKQVLAEQAERLLKAKNGAR